MKALSIILGILLLLAIGMIVKLKQDQKPPPPKTITTSPSDVLTEPEILLVLHLDDPVPTLQRYYNLFPGSKITEIDIGMNDPKSPVAKKINKELGLPLVSGKQPFPRKLLDKLIMENVEKNFLHFSSIQIGSSNLAIGSKMTTPNCTFPQIDPSTGNPIFGQVIPWIKFPDSSKPFFENAQKLGFSPCDTFITKAKEGYIIDPGGFLTLLQGNQKNK